MQYLLTEIQRAPNIESFKCYEIKVWGIYIYMYSEMKDLAKYLEMAKSPCNGLRKDTWTVILAPNSVQEQMLKCSRGLHPRRQLLHAPKLRQEVQDTSVRVLPTKVLALILNKTLAHPRRNQHGGDTDTQPVKGKSNILSILGCLGVGEAVTCGHAHGRGDMISETAVLVKSEDEERGVPLRRVANGLVDAFDEGFS